MYQLVDDETKGAMVDEIKTYTRDTQKVGLAERNNIGYEGQYKNVRQLDDPTEYLGTRVGYKAANDAEDWDMVDQMVKAAGQLSDKDLAYMRDHTNGFGTIYDVAQDGIGSATYKRYDETVDALVEEQGKKSANGYDIFRAVVNGDFTDEEADYFMNRKKSDGSYYAAKGRHSIYQGMRDQGYSPDIALEYWDKIDADHNGTLTKKEFDNALKKYKFKNEAAFKDSVYKANGWGKYSKKKKK